MDNSELVTKKDLEGVEDRLTELIRDVETKLVAAFHGYGKGQAAALNKGPNN